MSADKAIPMEIDDHVQASSSGAMSCICGDPGCENSLDQTQLEGLPLYTHQHKRRLHEALKSQDCSTVCQLLQTGMQFCTSSVDNCYVYIVKYCTPAFLDSALKLKPEAVNARGPDRLTLLMLCNSIEKMQVLLKYDPDLDAVIHEKETVLLHFVKHTLSNVAQMIVDSFRQMFVEGFAIDEEPLNHRNKVQNMVDGCNTMLQCIVQSGVNINAQHPSGNTALQVVLNLFENGYVFHDYHENQYTFVNSLNWHVDRICDLENTIAAQALSTLLQHESIVIPCPDEHGTTALMLACNSIWNIDNIHLLVQRGVDVNETDEDGHNAIHYLLESFVDHYCYLECFNFSGKKAATVDKLLCFLLDSGCELQGTDILMFKPISVDEEQFSVLVYLMSLKDSCLNERVFAGKQMLKNSQETCSYLKLFLKQRESDGSDENPMELDLKDVDLLAKEISAGLDVRQRLALQYNEYCDQEEWSEKLCVPDALRMTVYMQVVDCVVPEDRKERGPEYFKALDGVQCLLLPFWPHPPLALMIFPWQEDYWIKPDVDLCKRQVQFLHDIGGPLTRGSEVYHATRRTLQKVVHDAPGLQPVLNAFDELHAEIPSLLQMSRTVLRASVKEVDTKGLDFSHLKVWFEGELRSLPTPILKYLNFGKSPPKPAVSTDEEPEIS